MAKRALVLSGGGIFGAWQAGAWSVLARQFQPDLIVGTSVGSLNGYAIAAGCSHEEMLELWRRPQAAGFKKLPETIRELVEARPLHMDFAAVLVNLLRMREETFTNQAVTWRHLVASCAVPLLMRPVRIDGNWYLDGGLLHALPLAAALALDATEILALNVLAEFPEPALQPLVLAFRTVMSKAVVIPANVKVATLVPRKRLGNLKGASIWNAANVEKWYAQGIEDASSAFDGGQLAFLQNISTGDCLGP